MTSCSPPGCAQISLLRSLGKPAGATPACMIACTQQCLFVISEVEPVQAVLDMVWWHGFAHTCCQRNMPSCA